jgi:hypothetical protein
MDFEDKGGADFKWSVDAANNYTTSTGNSYVSRGALVEEADGNVAFAVKHYASKGKYFYFTIDDGSKLFKSINYGLYTISFKYKVTHSETPSAIGLAYVDAENGKFKKVFELASFEYEDQTEWNEITYTFGTDLYDINSYTNFALYVYNATNVPLINIDTNLETATTVLFDDVVVKTHAEVSEMGMIRFDNGLTISLETSFNINIKQNTTNVEIFGTKAGARVDPEVEIYTQYGGRFVNISPATKVWLDEDGLFESEIEGFIDAAEGKAPCRATGEDGLVVMKLIDAIYESAATGKMVEIH